MRRWSSRVLAMAAVALLLPALVLLVLPEHDANAILVEAPSVPNPATLLCGSLLSPTRHPAHVDSSSVAPDRAALLNGTRELGCRNRRGLQLAFVVVTVAMGAA